MLRIVLNLIQNEIGKLKLSLIISFISIGILSVTARTTFSQTQATKHTFEITFCPYT